MTTLDPRFSTLSTLSTLVSLAPTEGDDIISVVGSNLAGGSFDGGGGTDTLQLNGGGEFDLATTAVFQNFEIIRGSQYDDRITLSQNHLSGLRVIDGGVNSDPSGYGWNYLHLTGPTLDLRPIAISNITGIVINANNAVITVDEHSAAMAVRATSSQNDHLILDGVVLTAQEIAKLHRSGVDRISTLDGTLISVDPAPIITGLAGDRTVVSRMGTVFIDAGRDAVLSDGSGQISLLSASIKTGSWQNKIGLGATERVSFSVGSEGTVFVDGTEVGTFDTYGSGLSVHFNATATSERVSEVMHAITYEDRSSSYGGYTPASATEVEIRVNDDGIRQTRATVEIYRDAIGTPPADPTYPSKPFDPLNLDLVGTPAPDKLLGGSGHDILRGKLGNDVLTGGGERDMFIFDTKPGKKNVDTITDFNVVEDSIGLEKAVFKTLGKKTGVLKKSAFWKGKAAHDASDRIVHDTKNKVLLYDPDGNGSKLAVKFATINKVALTHQDFWVM